MIDVVSLVEGILNSAQWTETDPTRADIVWTRDEFNPNSPKLQVLVEDMPDKKTWITSTNYRIEHAVRISVYLKPVKYDPTTIDAAIVTLTNAKTMVDKILMNNKFLLTGICSVELRAGWDDSDSVTRGYGTKNNVGRAPKGNQYEPFQSQETAIAIYYSSYNNIPNDRRGVRVEEDDWAYFKLSGEIYIAEPELIDGGAYLCTPRAGSLLADLEDVNYHASISDYGTHWHAQLINALNGAVITSIVLKLGLSSGLGWSDGNITVSIRASDSNGHPTGSDLASATRYHGMLGQVMLDYEFVLSQYVTLTPNVNYCIVVRVPSGDVTHDLVVGSDDMNVYSRGYLSSSVNSGSSWTTVTGNDLYFRVVGIE
jgi:hypothetical protein